MWPFSKKEKKEKLKTSQNIEIQKIRSRMIQIPSLDFIGQYSESQNGKFLITWSDSGGGRGGARKSGEGSYILVEDAKMIINGKLQRPNDGKVANNGTFIINDWMFGDGLKGTFYAFDKSGNQLVKNLFSANLLGNGISEDGKYAVCQCANSHTEDSAILSFFDLENGVLLRKILPEVYGWANSYRFNVEKKEIILCYNDLGNFKYNFDGVFIDKEKWELERIKHASAFELSRIAKERFKEKENQLSSEDVQEILSLLNEALKRGLDDYPNEKATVYKTIGEIKEFLGKKDEAIYNYELALKENPKIGLKRHLNKLKNQKA